MVFVWLDPEAGFLMRQISMTPSRVAALRDDPEALKTAGRQPGEFGYVHAVSSFQLIDDPILAVAHEKRTGVAFRASAHFGRARRPGELALLCLVC